MGKTRKDECSYVDASNGVSFDENSKILDKISFGMIQIATIKISLSVKI